MSQSNHPQYGEEVRHLEFILDFLGGYKTEIANEKANIDGKVEYSLKHFNSDNTEQYNDLTFNLTFADYYERKLNELTKSQLKPYFARIDFFADDLQAEQRVYIGKLTLIRPSDNELLIADWRSPIATLYYEGRLGAASYTAPDGEITGEITLKRQYVIENGKLLDIMDIDITTNDEFLQAALGASKDRRLKDIVTTIQAEQNRIIRANMFKPLVVQGAAGGGKTTIALHRIAYLLYEHEKTVTAKNFMIFAPNRFFLSYISDVLPDLGVENVTQTTFLDFANQYIGRKLKVRPSGEALAALIESNMYRSPSLAASGLKSSLRFHQLIKRYITLILSKIVPKRHFDVEGYVLVNYDEINELFMNDYSYLPAASRVNEIKKYLSNTLKRMRPRILEGIDEHYERLRTQIKADMPLDSLERRTRITKILDERDAKLKAVRNKSKTVVRNYIKAFNILPSEKYYALLIKNTKLMRLLNISGGRRGGAGGGASGAGVFTDKELDLIMSITEASLDSGCLETDDLPPIMLIKHALFPPDDTFGIKHVVVDEAQDYSLFQFALLREILKTQSLSILGDLSQGIYSHSGITDWQTLNEVLDNPVHMTLEQSYRTTVEIMDAANVVMQKLKLENVPLARPVIRHGSPVEMIRADGLSDMAADIDKRIAEFKNAGYKSMAVICKTLAECEELKPHLKTKIKVIGGAEKSYEGGVLLLPSYLAKGLEFDAVLIANASDERYTDEPIDIKLLYIAMTRALHELVVYYCGERSRLMD